MKKWQLLRSMFGDDYELSTIEGRQVFAYIKPTCGFKDVKNLIEKSPELKELAELGYNLSTYAAASQEMNTDEFLEELFEIIENYQERYIELMAEIAPEEAD